MQRVVREGLVGDDIRDDAAADEIGKDVGRVGSSAMDRASPAARAASIRDSASSRVRTRSSTYRVASLRWIRDGSTFDDERDPAVHRDRRAAGRRPSRRDRR
jgi:hypothetical protein